MIQAMDLARENAALREETDRLRREVAELRQTIAVSPPGSLIGRSPDQADADHGSPGPSIGIENGIRLMVILPRHRGSEYGSFAARFAGVSDCRVIVDRRVMERRRIPARSPGGERRRGDRRYVRLDTPDALVVSVR